jgi:hypothetical protein
MLCATMVSRINIILTTQVTDKVVLPALEGCISFFYGFLLSFWLMFGNGRVISLSFGFCHCKKNYETCFSYGNHVSMIWRSCSWEVGFEAEPTTLKKKLEYDIILALVSLGVGIVNGDSLCSYFKALSINIKLSNPLKEKESEV